MRGSLWALVVLTLGVGVWVLFTPAPRRAEKVAEVLAVGAAVLPEPGAPRCLEPPEARQVVVSVPVGLPGRLGLYVARLEPGETEFRPSRVVRLAEREVFPLASNYKTAVWLETLRQADAGDLTLGETFLVTRANQSLGDYPYDGSDIPTLALRMIQWSDNTATDILHRRVGLSSLQPLADGLGLCNTRLLLPTKAWWTAQAGLGGPDFPKGALLKAAQRFSLAPPEERLRLAERLDQAAQTVGPVQLNKAIQPYFESRQWGRMADIDRGLQNVSTPLEWARFVWAAFTDNGLSDASNRRFLEVMSKGYGKRRLAVRAAYYGGKSGNTAGVLGYTGFLEAPDGSRYVYVFLSDTVPEIYTGYFERPAFSLINRALLALGAPPK